MTQKFHFQEIETCPLNDWHANVHYSFIHNSQNWKQVKCPSRAKQINKLKQIHTKEYYSKKLLLINRKELTTDTHNMCKSQKYNTKGKKSDKTVNII